MNNKSGDSKAMSGHLNRYLEVLRLRPGATLDEVNTTYYTIIKKFPQNPTEEEEQRLQELKHAYDMLRRSYAPKKKGIVVLLNKRLLIPTLSALTVVLLVALVVLNYGTIKLKLTHYNTGAVLRLKRESQPYGEVVGFEARHAFPIGNPSAAYAIKLADGQQTVWVSERLVVNGMAKAEK
jgi:curved DNA-binding protein CbpA